MRAIILKDAGEEIEVSCFDQYVCTIAKAAAEDIFAASGLDLEVELVKIIRVEITNKFGEELGFKDNEVWLVIAINEALSDYRRAGYYTYK